MIAAGITSPIAGATAAVHPTAVVHTSQAMISVTSPTPEYTDRITGYEDPDGNEPLVITVGPDGAMWFVNHGNGATHSIGRVTTSGQITHFTDDMTAKANGIVTGPDGALWFVRQAGIGSAAAAVGRMTTTGTVTLYTAPHVCGPGSITTGPDGALWFTSHSGCGFTESSIGRITTDGTITMFPDSRISPAGITAGPDGALWFTNSFISDGSIGRITTDGAISIFDDPGIVAPNGIVTGSDGALWFTNNAFTPAGSIGRITTDGTVSIFSDPALHHLGGRNTAAAGEMTQGPDGQLWFINSYGSLDVARMTSDGHITLFSYPSSSVAPNEIVAGPDGNLWFTWGQAGIGRVAPPPPELTVATTPSSLVFGDTATTGGELSAEGYGVPGKVVVQQRDAGGHKWTKVGSTTASASGAYSLTWVPDHTGKVRAVHPADPEVKRATSDARRQVVAAHVTLKATHRKARQGTKSVLSGTVLPVSPGNQVELQQRSGGRWVDVRSVPVSAAHKFRVAVNPPKGKSRWRIHQAGAAYLAAGHADVGLRRR